MARKMSNRRRIARAADEAEAAARTRSGRGAARESRQRIVWVVHASTGKAVKAFSYPQRDRAEAEAKRLHDTKGGEYYVQRGKVPL